MNIYYLNKTAQSLYTKKKQSLTDLINRSCNYCFRHQCDCGGEVYFCSHSSQAAMETFGLQC